MLKVAAAAAVMCGGEVMAAIDAPDELERTGYTASPRAITLGWTDNSNNETGFEIEASADGGANWTSFGQVAADVTTYSDDLASEETLYLFRVKAINLTETSTYSNIVSVEGTDPESADTDGDGMADMFEAANGLNAYRDDTYEDADGDRYPNIFEFIKGTLANDGESYPEPDYIADNSVSPGGNIYATVQGALDQVSEDYSVVQVNEGTYAGSGNVNLTMSGSFVVLLRSETGARTTVLDGGGTSRLITTSTSAVVDGLTLKNGWATNGGAISAGGGDLLVVNCVFSGNHAVAHGGALYQAGGTTLVVHSTFLENTAGTAGSGVYVQGGAGVLAKSILWDSGTSAEIALSGSTTMDVSESIVRGGYSGTTNSSSDPLLQMDGHLTFSSPAIDSGEILLTSMWDMDGEQRPAGTTTDLGADEWVDSDSDTLPDWWELDEFGDLDEGSGSDADGDGLTNLQEYQFGSDPKDYYSQAAGVITPSLTIVSGDGQRGTPSTFASGALVVQVMSGSTVLSNAPLTFAVTGTGGGQIAVNTSGTGLTTSLNLVTGTDGRAQVNFQYPSSYSVQSEIQVTAGTGTNAVQADFEVSTWMVPSSGLALWVKADSGVTKSGSNKVSAWDDNSGLANNSVQSGTNNQPLWVDNAYNGKPIIRFSGSSYLVISDTASLKPSTGYAVVAVVKQNTTTGGYQSLIGRGYRNSGWTTPFISYMCNTMTPTGGNYLGSSIATGTAVYRLLSTANTFDISKVQMVHWQYTGSAQEIYRNGYLVSSGTASGLIDCRNPSSITIGSRGSFSPGEYLSADVAEILFFNRSLNATEAEDIGEYLMAKYGETNFDTDGDSLPDFYEAAHGLNPLVDDSLYDKDGDGVPNQWEYVKGTSPNNVADIPAWDWVVDPAHGADSPSDNIVGTISAAITAVAADQSYKTIFVKKGEYSEQVLIPSNKYIALVGEKGGEPVRLLGGSVTQVAVRVQSRSVIDGFVITRPRSAIAAGTVTETGVYAPASGQVWRIANCIVTGHAFYGGIYNDSGGTAYVDHCTVYGNKGAGVSAYSSKLNLLGTIIWNEQLSSTSLEVQLITGATVSAAGCLIRGGAHSSLNSNPQLTAGGMLKSTSPAINASTNLTALGADIQGESRPAGAARDIGADEFVDSDSDGLPDQWEMENFADLDETGSGDTDGDGLNNSGEYAAATNPNAGDTDGDGATDSEEVGSGTNPWLSDSDGDGMQDGYEIENGLNAVVDDSLYDRDGDGVPNQWEYAKGTAAGDKEDSEPDWIVDPAHASDSPSDNIVATIAVATGTVPVDNGTVADSYKTILVKRGEYAEKVVIPNNKRIALVGERGAIPVKVTGTSITDYVLDMGGRSVVDGVMLTRPTAAIQAGTVNAIGVLTSGTNTARRIGNCVITAHAGAGVSHSAGTLVIDHCTIFNNRVTNNNRTGITVESGAVAMNLQGSILWTDGSPTPPEIWNGYGKTVTAAGNLIRGGTYSSLNSNPQLTVGGMLKATSPAINSGTSAVVLGGDIQGEARPYGGTKDIGADEFVDSDSDGLPDAEEMEYFGDLDEIDSGDPDGDGVDNLTEMQQGLNPANSDSDGDGAWDGAEITAGTSPRAPDSDGDKMLDGYEIDNGLNPLSDDSQLDKDGDGVPNLWEFAKGAAAGDKEDVIADWIVDPAHASDSPSDNIVGTIAVATGTVPVDNGNVAASYKTILVKSGTYAESVTIASNKRVALVGERGGRAVMTGSAVNATVLSFSEKSVVDGLVITRPPSAIFDGSVTATGVFLGNSAGNGVGRIVNCLIFGHSTGVEYPALTTGSPSMEYCTIFRNKTYGTYTPHRDRVTTIKNCIIWNVQTGTANQYGGAGAVPPGTLLLGNIVYGGQYGGANSDPLLTAEGLLNYGSAAIDAAAATAGVNGDIHGEARPNGGARDLGADEWIDSDSDTLADVWELRWYGDLDETASGDGDGDGLDNLVEMLHGTNPEDDDTDADGASDSAEVTAGTSSFLADSDKDKMSDGYEIDNGLNPLSDDSQLDKDGDGVPNLWEFAKGAEAGDVEDVITDWIVDPAHANDSPSDNIVGTIGVATGTVPVDNGNVAASYKTILVKSGTYAEGITIPSNKRVALVGERGGKVVVTGSSVTTQVLSLREKSVVDGLVLTRPPAAIQNGSVTGAGVFLENSAGNGVGRLVNCLIYGHARGLSFGTLTTGTPSVEYCTIFRNTLYGVYSVDRDRVQTIKNCVIWNVQSGTANQYGGGGTAPPGTLLQGNIVYGGQYGGTNSEPFLSSEGLLNYGSAAIDAAAATVGVNGDIHGETRPNGGARDMGADEWVDTDGDHLSDVWEMKWFGDLDEVASGDGDDDGLMNNLEALFDMNPNDPDTDDDGRDDLLSVLSDTSHPYFQGAWSTDTDGDGVTDMLEGYWGTNPALVDTNGDGVSDYQALLNDIDPTASDTDGDGLNNDVEGEMGTNPLMADSDHDGVNDNLDWYPNDQEQSDAPGENPLDTTGPELTLILPDGVVVTP